MTITNIKAHTRGKEDPFKPVMEARKERFCRKWGIQPANTDDARLSRPVAPPEPISARTSMPQIIEQLRGLARLAAKIGE
ncbi:MAG: hypothetical protein K0M55_19950 [Rhizobium sp.]|nr:hypothetical protein [Rhizobium sp.]MBW8318494.1 hypothetical protein [Rhizobium sp.]MBW8445213.1 hypothetical protein [Arenimonas sp.]